MLNLVHIALLIFGWASGNWNLVLASLVLAIVCLVMSFCFYIGQTMRRNYWKADKSVTMIWIQTTVIVLSLIWLCVKART